ncbi:MAG: Nif3-like dinuclear metal center hexameric protein [Gemmataceae bacterium]|nr:Nif3-like dinuclear metal center hexameric protein [Gemmataceae bacterium]
MPTVANFIEYLERFAPNHLAADWDNVGLLLGDRAADVQRVMTCLTVTPDSAGEAVEAGAHLIVTHHPILFRGAKRLTTANPEGRTVLSLVKAGVSVYSPHTAFDNTKDGINEILAQRLGLTDVVPLQRRDGPKQCKVVVFVPVKDLGRVSDAMFAAGAGHIGEYSECSFRLPGTGTFFGSDASNPVVGQKGKREEADEVRLEVVCPENLVEAVVAAVRRSHSYEEPAFDVYPLRPLRSSLGDGRIGKLPQPTPLAEMARLVKNQLGAGAVQFVGDGARPVKRLAILCGAGGEMLMDAVRSPADTLLTGELRFHDYLTAQALGLSLILPGHYATERCGVEELAGRLQQQFADVRVWSSQRERDPADWVTG